MPRHQETRFLPFTAAQMFALVADIERYPQFLPWVQALRIKSRDGDVVTADMVVGFKMVRERFTSRVLLEAPHRIVVNYLSGPLKHLQNDWTFRDVPGTDGRAGCEIDFLVDFEFQNRMFERLAGMFFGEALRRMVGAFEARAQALYGDGTGGGVSGSSSPSATIVA